MEHHQEAPWIFVIREEMLPGRFSIQPVQPSVFQLKEQDPEGDILFHSYVAVLTASAKYEAYKEERWIRRHSVEVYAKFVVEELKRALGVKRIFVIPEEEFYRRVARGEFEGTQMPTEEEKQQMGLAFHDVLGEVLDNYYRGLPSDRQEHLLQRMRPHAAVEGIKNLWGFCALYDKDNGGLRWRYISKPEVVRFRHQTMPLPTHWKMRPRTRRVGMAA